MKFSASKLSYGLLCLCLGAIGYFATSLFVSAQDPTEAPYFSVTNTGGTSPKNSQTEAANAATTSDSDKDISLVSSGMDPSFVDYLYTARIQLELNTVDVEMIETRLLADLPDMAGSKYQDPRHDEVAARVAILRALNKAHRAQSVNSLLLPVLARTYKKILQSPNYNLHFKAQALRNLSSVGIGADELARDEFLKGVDPRIHRLAAMSEIDELVTEE